MSDSKWMQRMRRLKGLRYWELGAILAVLLIVVSTWAFMELADEVLEGSTQYLDERIVYALRNPEEPSMLRGPRWVGEAARDITALGSYAILTLVIVAAAGFLLLQRNYGAMWLIVIAATGGGLLSFLLKIYFGRERPDIGPHFYYTSPSFPSGHAMASAAVYLSLGVLLARIEPKRRVKFYLMAMAMLVTFLVGITRVVLGVHYPTDVLAGWSAGLVWALLCWLVALYLQRQGALKDENEQSRPPCSNGD